MFNYLFAGGTSHTSKPRTGVVNLCRLRGALGSNGEHSEDDGTHGATGATKRSTKSLNHVELKRGKPSGRFSHGCEQADKDSKHIFAAVQTVPELLRRIPHPPIALSNSEK